MADGSVGSVMDGVRPEFLVGLKTLMDVGEDYEHQTMDR